LNSLFFKVVLQIQPRNPFPKHYRQAPADIVPYPVPSSKALLKREAREKEILEEDPAMLTSTLLQAAMSASATGSQSYASSSSRAKNKGRTVNGRERMNRTSHGSKREKRSRDVND
jgi:hypothetical protein